MQREVKTVGEVGLGKQKTHETWEHVNKLLRTRKHLCSYCDGISVVLPERCEGERNGVECITEGDR